MSYQDLIIYIPQLEDDGPEPSTLVNNRITFHVHENGRVDHLTDDWRSSAYPADSRCWTGTRIFFTTNSEKIGGDVGSSGSSGRGILLADIDISSLKPWGGEEPPLPMYAEDTDFVRREDGIWRRRDIRGRLYLVIVMEKGARDQLLLSNPVVLIETNGEQVI